MVDAQLFSSETVEWYTPKYILDLAVEVMGSITLDPCSNHLRSTPAEHHFTKEDDGLSKEWFGNVFMNPPYGRDIKKWTEYLTQQNKNIDQHFTLLPARTDTKWFQSLEFDSACFLKGRIKFIDSYGNALNSAPFPSVITYYGNNIDLFNEVMKNYGLIAQFI